MLIATKRCGGCLNGALVVSVALLLGFMGGIWQEALGQNEEVIVRIDVPTPSVPETRIGSE